MRLREYPANPKLHTRFGNNPIALINIPSWSDDNHILHKKVFIFNFGICYIARYFSYTIINLHRVVCVKKHTSGILVRLVYIAATISWNLPLF